METNVLIAVAGPTAVTLEIEVRIVAKAAEFFAGSRGDGIQSRTLGIQSRTLEVFDDLGVIDHVLTHGSLPPIIHAHCGGKFVGEW
jgi:2-polyprenyl-6-methoxyphenol hydroxylase-like FAD-dependent oxidoreductase